MRLKDKVAVITGGGRGIGKAIARKFAAEGATLALLDVDETTVMQCADEMRTLGVKAQGFKADVTSSAQVEEAMKKTAEAFGAIHILVNNAGITRDGLILRMKEEEWDIVLNVNLKSAFLCTKYAIKYIMKAGYGRIISIASVVGLMGNAGQANYSASKGGLVAFTKTIAKEFAGRGVTANAIAPGFIRSAMTDKLGEEVKKKYIDAIPLNRFGEAEDVADTAAFLASPEAAYVTGQVLAVDGGMTM